MVSDQPAFKPFWLLVVVALLPGLVRGATTPTPADGASRLVPAARQWLELTREDIRLRSRRFGVDPVVIGAIVAAEIANRSFVDDMEEDYVRRLLREKDDDFFRALQAAFLDRTQSGGKSLSAMDRMIYFWSLGAAQVQVRVALEIEDRIARLEERAPRPLRAILQSLLDERECLDFVCAVVRRASDAYHRIAGIDISRDVGVLATVYNLGSPEARARHLAQNPQHRRRPGKNLMGRRAEALAGAVRRILAEKQAPETNSPVDR